MNRIVAVRCSISLLLAATMLGGCSWFHHRTDYYSKAAETRPLEVPPDLDTPVTSNELLVPQPGSGASIAGASSVSAAPPTSGSAPVVATADSSNGLRVSDSAEHTWQRVGLALERAQLGTISARDEASRTYTIAVTGLGEAESAEPTEHHWYSRILHPFGGSSKSAPVSGDVVVKVSSDGGAARVDVEGSPEAARRVLAVLRDRLS